MISDGHFDEAVELYTKAIELCETEAVYYANRSFAYLKTELYGGALSDASKAIEIDPKYSKAYYRRATANMALGKFKLALKDYEAVYRAHPNDPGNHFCDLSRRENFLNIKSNVWYLI